MFPFINLGWIPGYLQTCGNMLRQHSETHRSPTIEEKEYFAAVMKYVDMHPRRLTILSDLHNVSRIMADSFTEGETPEECYSKILDSYGI